MSKSLKDKTNQDVKAYQGEAMSGSSSEEEEKPKKAGQVLFGDVEDSSSSVESSSDDNDSDSSSDEEHKEIIDMSQRIRHKFRRVSAMNCVNKLPKVG